MTSPAPPLPLRPSDELVAVQWIGTIPDLIPLGGTQIVATTLPPDVNQDGTPAAWTQTGFVTVSVVGGSPGIDLPVSAPVMQVDVWATVPGSNRPPWFMASAIANAIRYACWSRAQTPRPLSISVKGKAYPLAVVQAAVLTTSFRRRYSDAADYALMSADMWLSWIAPEERLD